MKQAINTTDKAHGSASYFFVLVEFITMITVDCFFLTSGKVLVLKLHTEFTKQPPFENSEQK